MTLQQRLVDRFLAELNITRDTVKKVLSIIDQIDFSENDNEISINIKLKNIQIVITK